MPKPTELCSQESCWLPIINNQNSEHLVTFIFSVYIGISLIRRKTGLEYKYAFLWGSLPGAVLYRYTSTIKINTGICPWEIIKNFNRHKGP